MQTASFTGFIKTLFYFVAFYYIFKFVAKLLLPLLVKKVVKKAGENFQQQQRSQDTSWQKAQSNDEIIIDTSNSKKPRESKKVGDYVDYEEID
ncbi:DUF4834 family protein [Flavobacterium sp. XN-5]|uniref:DUF4834 family protein n=1 Tax=Flavobacterium sp. XN-5 TaxID=2599390 RepID=UPI0011CB4AC8|nr:DUF4834 family protein [Flavobacterium sp. XN-5]NGY38121.1 DUF4834 family protein [Flavobacterium sp. XN-5]